ncbi:MAG: hypothetical protein M3Q91_17180, partial [Acidobacteriota bacterium]|nr:hypothetical protein [Acidobacteriota bacterium]
RQHPPPCSEKPPHAVKLAEDVQNSVGPREQTLAWLPIVSNNINRIEVDGVDVITLQEGCGKLTLEGREPKVIVRVTLK